MSNLFYYDALQKALKKLKINYQGQGDLLYHIIIKKAYIKIYFCETIIRLRKALTKMGHKYLKKYMRINDVEIVRAFLRKLLVSEYESYN